MLILGMNWTRTCMNNFNIEFTRPRLYSESVSIKSFWGYELNKNTKKPPVIYLIRLLWLYEGYLADNYE